MAEELKNEVAEEAAEEQPATKREEKKEDKKQRRAEAELLQAQKRVEELEAELAAAKDTHLRLAAEYDNFRKRTQKEREGIYTDAYGEALAALFPVVDNLERAAQYTDGENVAKGVLLTLKGVQDTFTKLGVTEINPVGEAFDPNLHNAVMHLDDEAYEENTIVQVFQKGFKLGDKVIRFAMVQVAN